MSIVLAACGERSSDVDARQDVLRLSFLPGEFGGNSGANSPAASRQWNETDENRRSDRAARLPYLCWCRRPRQCFSHIRVPAGYMMKRRDGMKRARPTSFERQRSTCTASHGRRTSGSRITSSGRADLQRDGSYGGAWPLGLLIRPDDHFLGHLSSGPPTRMLVIPC